MKNRNPYILHVPAAPTLHVLLKVEQKREAAIPLVTLWWLNTVCSYQQLLPCITCNYKWPWAADEEPIRFQLACQPKTNYLLALTAGFYLHNSNPSVNWRLRVTHSYEAEMTVYRQVRMRSPAAFQHRETHLINAEAKCDNSRPLSHLTGHLSNSNWSYMSHLTSRYRLIRRSTHSFHRGRKIMGLSSKKTIQTWAHTELPQAYSNEKMSHFINPCSINTFIGEYVEKWKYNTRMKDSGEKTSSCSSRSIFAPFQSRAFLAPWTSLHRSNNLYRLQAALLYCYIPLYILQTTFI